MVEYLRVGWWYAYTTKKSQIKTNRLPDHCSAICGGSLFNASVYREPFSLDCYVSYPIILTLFILTVKHIENTFKKYNYIFSLENFKQYHIFKWEFGSMDGWWSK